MMQQASTAEAAVMHDLNIAATSISKLSSEKQAEWVVYLLEVLEGKTEVELAEHVLFDVRQAISERMATGQW